MNQEVENVEVLAETEAAEQAAYDEARGVVQAEKVEEVEQESEGEVATETPQTEPEAEAAKDELTELRSQVEKMGDVFKRLDDVNGRYGRLSQRVEEMQQRIATATTASEAAANTADAGELMADLREEFPELADKLQGVFSKVMASKGGGSPDPEAVMKAVTELRAAEVAAETQELETQLDDLYPGWEKVAGSRGRNVQCSPEFVDWLKTLSPREAKRLDSSRDPYFIADMLDKHKEWLNKPKAQPTPTTTQANRRRLADAVTPKGENAPLSATQISEQEAYDKARAEARRIKR